MFSEVNVMLVSGDWKTQIATTTLCLDWLDFFWMTARQNIQTFKDIKCFPQTFTEAMIKQRTSARISEHIQLAGTLMKILVNIIHC